MSSGSGENPGGSSPGRPAADTPQRLVVRPTPGEHEPGMGDTAVAEDLGRTATDAITPLERGPTELIDTTLAGRYHVTRKIGQGGMGAVYEATHTLINKQVAIKVLLEKYAQREAVVKRLAQEAQLASSLKNEHIIDI